MTAMSAVVEFLHKAREWRGVCENHPIGHSWQSGLRLRWHRCGSRGYHLSMRKKLFVAKTTKLSVEKVLNKMREADVQKSQSTRHEEQIDALNEEIKRVRAQRLRLEAHQRGSTKRG